MISNLLIYLLGVIIAMCLVGRAIYHHPDNGIECSGFILGYCFSLLSWFTVLMFLLKYLDDKIGQHNHARFSQSKIGARIA